MTSAQLKRLLLAAVTLPAAMLTAACECPHTVVVESEDKALGSDAACDAAGQRIQNFDGYYIGGATCAQLCGDAKFNACELDQAYLSAYDSANPTQNGWGGAGGTGDGGSGGGGNTGITCPSGGATLACQITETRGQQYSGCPIAGRRPAGLPDLRPDSSEVGRFLASSAYFEAAAVIAFERLATELSALGASAELGLDLARAARDEVRHAAAMAGLATRYGGSVEAPVVAPAIPRSVEEIAVENVSEGIVNETFAAAVALFQAEHAEDPAIRAAMQRIAADECAHAALAFRIDEHLHGLLDHAARARIAAHRRQAIEALAASLDEPAAEVCRLAGLPTRAQAMAICERMAGGVWAADPSYSARSRRAASSSTSSSLA